MSITPEALEAEFSLPTAATRLDFLSRRDSGSTELNTVRDTADDDWASSLKDIDTSLDTYEALELLALGEVVARKAHAGRPEGILAALRGGADWTDVAAALDVPPAYAWDEYTEWLDEQEALRERGEDALDADEVVRARALAGGRPEA